MSNADKYERPIITVVGGKDHKEQKQQSDPQDEILWCKVCGEAVGIYVGPEEGYIYDGNYCKRCGTRITE